MSGISVDLVKVPLLTPPSYQSASGDTSLASAIESFSPIRQYVIAGVLIVLAALIAVNWVSAKAERGIIVSRLEEEAIGPAEVATFSIVEQVSLRSGSNPEIAALDDLNWMDRTVLNAVVGQPVARVDIVNTDGKFAYSTDHSLIGMTNELFAADAWLTRSESRYVESAQILSLDGETHQLDVVEVRVPVFQEASLGLMGDPKSIVVVYRDVTSSVATATAASGQYRTITIMGVMVVMFGALLLVVARGHLFARAARIRLEAMLNRANSLAEQLDFRNEQLRAANEAKNRFLSVVTHELNTPLTSILAFTDLLKRNRRGTLSERDIQQLEAISRNGHQMGMLIRDLLDLSRIESGTMTLESERFGIGELLLEITETMAPIVKGRNQSMIVNLRVDEIEINADRRRLQQVVSNLLSNASKYSSPGSRIWLESEVSASECIIAIRDEGIGIEDADLQQIFTPFFRAQNEETRRMPGTGLGLVICRQIVGLHGGTLKIDSIPGRGTTAKFGLPLTVAQESSVQAAA